MFHILYKSVTPKIFPVTPLENCGSLTDPTQTNTHTHASTHTKPPTTTSTTTQSPITTRSQQPFRSQVFDAASDQTNLLLRDLSLYRAVAVASRIVPTAHRYEQRLFQSLWKIPNINDDDDQNDDTSKQSCNDDWIDQQKRHHQQHVCTRTRGRRCRKRPGGER